MIRRLSDLRPGDAVVEWATQLRCTALRKARARVLVRTQLGAEVWRYPWEFDAVGDPIVEEYLGREPT